MDIGHRLKAVRTKAALSQRELAKRSGVTNGFISQIEKNQVSPSVASCARCWKAFPCRWPPSSPMRRRWTPR